VASRSKPPSTITILIAVKKGTLAPNCKIGVWRVRMGRNGEGRQNTGLLPALEVKGKAIPLQAMTGPEGSRRLRLPDFKTIGT
jgi:hypothetical protein